jgi:predicted GNAT family acetyltransferase
MAGTTMTGVADPEMVVLTETDVPEILDLVERTKPGPFAKRTIEMGHYLGIRRDGRLIAMAGERLRLPGWTEISAVCTDPDFRGQGLAARLTMAVAAGILGRGELPFLHAAATNTDAIRLYEGLGFQVDHHVVFAGFRTTA